MQLSHALRLTNSSCLALVGAGGKTTALSQLARELTPVMVTTTTHLGEWQITPADHHILVESGSPSRDLEQVIRSGITFITGPVKGERFDSPPQEIIHRLRAMSQKHHIPLLIEADGARQKPLKVPAANEPIIPNFVDAVVVVAGLSALGKPMTDEWIHRLNQFKQITGSADQSRITAEMIVKAQLHPEGGLKRIPAHARRIALLNQADTIDLQSIASKMAHNLISSYHSVVIAALSEEKVFTVHEPSAGVILAAGEASRFNKPKQVLEWRGKPLIRAITEIALQASLSEVVVVTGAYHEQVQAAIQDLPVKIVKNVSWQSGQGTSIRAGLQALSPETGAAIFLLADQPLVTRSVLQALVERHNLDLSPVVAPLVQGQRANPVLFDRCTFPDLISLEGDVGGRQIFSKYPVVYLPWHDQRLLYDIDTEEEYMRLIDENY